MIIKTNVPNKLYQQLLAGKTIPAKTDFKHGFSEKAYRLLAKYAHMDNFFFGIVPDTELPDDLITHLTDSNTNNNTILTLDIPESELFIHDFYEFSGMIYDNEDYDNLHLSAEILDQLAAKALSTHTPNAVSQVIYPELRPEWVISAETITK